MMYGMGGFGIGWIFMVVVWLLIILGVVALIKWLSEGRSDGKEADGESARRILDERYARGEIDRDEYEQKRRDMSSS